MVRHLSSADDADHDWPAGLPVWARHDSRCRYTGDLQRRFCLGTSACESAEPVLMRHFFSSTYVTVMSKFRPFLVSCSTSCRDPWRWLLGHRSTILWSVNHLHHHQVKIKLRSILLSDCGGNKKGSFTHEVIFRWRQVVPGVLMCLCSAGDRRPGTQCSCCCCLSCCYRHLRCGCFSLYCGPPGLLRLPEL